MNLQENVISQYMTIRSQTTLICSPLEVEDYVVQPFPEVSPPKWHLAHTTWFFEEFILKKFSQNYSYFNESYPALFNSYYKKLGPHWSQDKRGELSRPTVKEVLSYRNSIDDRMQEFLKKGDFPKETLKLIEIGLNHEQQHQELLYMDIKSILAANPSFPIYKEKELSTPSLPPSNEWFSIDEGLYEIGPHDLGFSYDNERPCHKKYLQKCSLRKSLVTNADYLEFVENGGYQRPELWLSLGLDWANKSNIHSPLYWFKKDDKWYEYTLYGATPLDPHSPVMHISYFEAFAFSKWAKCRLPLEEELEIFLKNTKEEQSGHNEKSLHPYDANQARGQLWTWSQSSYSPYPRFKEFSDEASEYNGKFMCNQMVLRGGSVITPKEHYRDTYRNFFSPEQRWMFAGLRLAKDS